MRQSRCFTLPVMVSLITITDAAMTLTVSIYPVTVLKQPVIVLKQPVIVLELTITDTWMDPHCDFMLGIVTICLTAPNLYNKNCGHAANDLESTGNDAGTIVFHDNGRSPRGAAATLKVLFRC